VKFGAVALDAAVGAILAHSLSVDGTRLRKGTVLTAEHLTRLSAAGHTEVIVAQLEPGDMAEDAAAQRVARALAGTGVRLGPVGTGRCNLYAEHDGVVTFEPAAIHAINGLDESLTVATVPPLEAVHAGQMVATVKVIPYAAPAAAVAQAVTAAIPMQVRPYRALSVGLIQTVLPGLKDSVMDKTVSVTRARVERCGGTLGVIETVAHDPEMLAAQLREITGDLVLIVGASAIADRADVIPAAIEAAGGSLIRFGMPVDPGNLLCLGDLGGRPVIGLPGCARSPKLNGLDWVLARLMAGIPVTGGDIAAMGVGGLLEDVPERPLPRRKAEPEATSPATQIGAILLSAGQSRRMGAANKLLLPLDGEPLVRHAARALLAGGCTGLLAVTGHEADAVAEALADLAPTTLTNPHPELGLSSSVRLAASAWPDDWAAAVIGLGDMPHVQPATIAALIAAFDDAAGRTIVVPSYRGKRGNPVLWGRRHRDWFAGLSGDIGAKALLSQLADHVVEVAVDDPGILADVDTPEAYAALTQPRP
jgi:molybdenum cofactor cytidylyltransferase